MPQQTAPPANQSDKSDSSTLERETLDEADAYAAAGLPRTNVPEVHVATPAATPVATPAAAPPGPGALEGSPVPEQL